jgi:uncharacterized protein YggE
VEPILTNGILRLVGFSRVFHLHGKFPMNRSSPLLIVLLLVAAVVMPVGRLAAQQPGTITVTGSGAASAPPSHAVVKGKLHVAGESGEKALESYRELRDELEKKLAGGETTRTSVRFRGEQIVPAGSPEMAAALGGGGFGGGAIAPAASGQFSVVDLVELRVDFMGDMERAQATEKIAELIDAASAAGVSFGIASNPFSMAMGSALAQGVAEFRLENPAAVREQAYAAAIADARQRAERLAALAGGKLGKVVSIEEVDIETSNENPYVSAIMWGMQQSADKPAKFSTDRNSAIEVRTDVRVSFQLLTE